MAVTPSGKDKLVRYMRIYIDEFDMSGYARSVSSMDCMITEVDRTSWVDAHKNFIGDNLLIAGIRGWRGILDIAASGPFEQFKDHSAGLVSVAFGGLGEPAIGDPAYLLRADHTMLQAALDAGLVVFDNDFVPDTAQYVANAHFPWGAVHQEATTLSATVTASSSNSIDWERTDIADGGWANLHVLESSGGTWAFKLRDSADDSAWADITGGGFTLDGSAVGSESIEFAGDIDRYTALEATRTSGTVKVLLVVALNIPY